MITHAQIEIHETQILDIHEATPTIMPQPDATQGEPPSKTKNAQVKSSMSISNALPLVSYGFIVPGEPIIRADTISVKSSHAHQFSIFVHEDTPLEATDGTTIPDTTCDDGGCTPAVGSQWKSPLTYGLGYRCEKSRDCLHEFSNQLVYRPLAPSRSTLSPQMIATGLKQSTIDFVLKLNVSGSQKPVPYVHTITYTTVPNL